MLQRGLAACPGSLWPGSAPPASDRGPVPGELRGPEQGGVVPVYLPIPVGGTEALHCLSCPLTWANHSHHSEPVKGYCHQLTFRAVQ